MDHTGWLSVRRELPLMLYKLSFKRKPKLATRELMRILRGKRSLTLGSGPSNS